MNEPSTGSVLGRSHFFDLAARMLERLSRRGSPETEPRIKAVKPHRSSAMEATIAKLARLDKRRARIVELRFLFNVNMADIARMLDSDEQQVELEWRLGRAWINRELAKTTQPGGTEPMQ
ncbi:MAG: DNA-directed RNA polymerase specialized sigma24 family protein [Planctomycetota bacterium]|jgi:DNA-directed RNA polymerase specialized sigma24 family protein